LAVYRHKAIDTKKPCEELLPRKAGASLRRILLVFVIAAIVDPES
jgi:hypothetical protein